MSGDLTGKVVVVAGAPGSAGPPLVERLAGRGAVAVAVARDGDALDRLAASVRRGLPPGRVETEAVDLLDEQATLALARRVLDRHGRVDGLAHLVGGWRGGRSIIETDLADWGFLSDLLVRTLQHTTRAFHDPLRSGAGRLCIVSSSEAGHPSATNAVYAAAKAAAEAWTLAVADSFTGSDAAAVILTVRALVTPQMRAAKPDKAFHGFTDVGDLAEEVCALWDTPAEQLNGQRLVQMP